MRSKYMARCQDCFPSRIVPVLALLWLSAQPLRPQAAANPREPVRAEAALLDQGQAALKARRWQEAVPLLRAAIALDPGRWEAHQALGNACLNLGEYQDAIDAYEKGLALCQGERPAGEAQARLRAARGQMLVGAGNACLKLRKPQAAVVYYRKAAELDPNPGQAYFNLAATLYNQGLMEEAAQACDQAIAADPGRVDAYFIKGSALYGNGRLDAQNRYTVPPGTVAALKKYLELAPEGGHAIDVKAMLDALGTPIETSYKTK